MKCKNMHKTIVSLGSVAASALMQNSNALSCALQDAKENECYLALEDANENESYFTKNPLLDVYGEDRMDGNPMYMFGKRKGDKHEQREFVRRLASPAYNKNYVTAENIERSRI